MAKSKNLLGNPQILVACGGVAALSWEVVWQIKASLALGVSAWGTALTLAVMMGGMSIGSLGMGHALRKRPLERPGRVYGALEGLIGVCGLLLGCAFKAIEMLDTYVYVQSPAQAPVIYFLGIVAVLGIPTICMGATLPVLGLVAAQFRLSVATLYGLNTLGASAGALIAAFFLIPAFGIEHASWIIAAVNIAVAICAWHLPSNGKVTAASRATTKLRSSLSPMAEKIVVIVTGFATFALEIAWFRSLTSAFLSTTDAFAIMLACVLLALGAAAKIVPMLKRRKVSLGMPLALAGILIIAVTPITERFDLITSVNLHPFVLFMQWGILTLYVIGTPMFLLGMACPWLLDDQDSPRRWAKLYALNTLAAIAGALGAAWILLPTIGVVRTAWIIGMLVAATGILIAPRNKRPLLMGCAFSALLIAVIFQSGVGRTRSQGGLVFETHRPNKLLEYFEGPEASVSAISYDNGDRALVINGFLTAAEMKTELGHTHYMAWMGHLPMLLHPNPKNALVICFGTGQTANAVRQENPQSLDIVDINPRVLRLAHNFPSNENVLQDPRAHPTIMDGRAYMRRTNKVYDVITLEPMPPNFAGVNALYSKEFYELARDRLTPQGMIAQWLPFHLVAPRYIASIARTFQEVFPNAILWLDPGSHTGILLGTKDDKMKLGNDWPGFLRPGAERDLNEKQVRKAITLRRRDLARYGAYGDVITDDNQLLAYGKATYLSHFYMTNEEENAALLDKIKKSAP